MDNKVRITFGIIILNGEPFTRYLLRMLYPFAHQIIIVEGACEASSAVSTVDGHSTDGTIEAILDYKANHDPENKIVLVTAKDEGYTNGFWPEKDQMSRAYARRATGNYLWQVDSDEFYQYGDMVKITQMLVSGVDMVTFPVFIFWGGLDYTVNGFYVIKHRIFEANRIFAWGQGYNYKTHRPPVVLDEKGIDLKSKQWIKPGILKKQGIYLYHYCSLFPRQVSNKVAYYAVNSLNKKAQRGGFVPDIGLWEKETFLKLSRPFHVYEAHHSLSWLSRFNKSHPQEIINMMRDIKAGVLPVELRRTDDIDKLLSNPFYFLAGKILMIAALLENSRIYRLALKPWQWFRSRILR